MLFALAYYSELYSGVAAQVARSNTVARHFTQTPRCSNIEIYYVRTAVFINTEGKNGKRGACVRRACGRVSGSRNASGGRVQNMVVCVYTTAVPRMRRVVRNGCLRGLHRKPWEAAVYAVSLAKGGAVLFLPCRRLPAPRLRFSAVVIRVHTIRRALHTASAPIADMFTYRTPNGAYVKYFWRYEENSRPHFVTINRLLSFISGKNAWRIILRSAFMDFRCKVYVK